MSTAPANSEAAIFARMMDAESTELTPEGARSWLTIDFSVLDRTRMHELSQMAQAGSLSVDEERELDSYRDLGNLLAVMHSRARRELSK